MHALTRATWAIFVVIALTLTSCSTDPGTDAGFVSGDGSITVLPPEQRQVAPNASGVDLLGDPLELADFAG